MLKRRQLIKLFKYLQSKAKVRIILDFANDNGESFYEDLKGRLKEFEVIGDTPVEPRNVDYWINLKLDKGDEVIEVSFPVPTHAEFEGFGDLQWVDGGPRCQVKCAIIDC